MEKVKRSRIVLLRDDLAIGLILDKQNEIIDWINGFSKVCNKELKGH